MNVKFEKVTMHILKSIRTWIIRYVLQLLNSRLWIECWHSFNTVLHKEVLPVYQTMTQIIRQLPTSLQRLCRAWHRSAHLRADSYWWSRSPPRSPSESVNMRSDHKQVAWSENIVYQYSHIHIPCSIFKKEEMFTICHWSLNILTKKLGSPIHLKIFNVIKKEPKHNVKSLQITTSWNHEII